MFGRHRSSGEQVFKSLNPAMRLLAEKGYGGMVGLLATENGRQALRAVWGRIDYVQPEESVRLFAGVSADGQRYYEVYRRGESPDSSDVVVAAAALAGGQVTLVAGRRLLSRNGTMTVNFADPLRPESERTNPISGDSTLDIRLAKGQYQDSGTSSYYDGPMRGVRSTYEGELFPIGYMQKIADFDADQPRTSTTDEAVVENAFLKINGAPPPASPSRDDIAI